MRQKGVHLLLEAWRDVGPRHPDVGLVVVGFGDARAELEAAAPPGTVFTGAMDHEQLQRLVPLAEAVVVPSVLPEAFGMVAAEAASCEVVPIVADHSGLAEVAAGLGEAGITFDGSSADLARRLDALLDLAPEERARLGAVARAAVVARWSWEGIAQRCSTAPRVASSRPPRRRYRRCERFRPPRTAATRHPPSGVARTAPPRTRSAPSGTRRSSRSWPTSTARSST